MLLLDPQIKRTTTVVNADSGVFIGIKSGKIVVGAIDKPYAFQSVSIVIVKVEIAAINLDKLRVAIILDAIGHAVKAAFLADIQIPQVLLDERLEGGLGDFLGGGGCHIQILSGCLVWCHSINILLK